MTLTVEGLGELLWQAFDECLPDVPFAPEAAGAVAAYVLGHIELAERPADAVVIETDWNNLDAHGVVRHTGVGLPKVWARDGDEEAPVLGFLVDFTKTRALTAKLGEGEG